ncbi:erythronolide synthase, modules 3 and 4, partial [Haematococcus lacustris]
LLAAKSCVGHAEPASGLLGLQAAVQQLGAQSALPVMHLRSLNPHVADAVTAAPMGR